MKAIKPRNISGASMPTLIDSGGQTQHGSPPLESLKSKQMLAVLRRLGEGEATEQQLITATGLSPDIVSDRLLELLRVEVVVPASRHAKVTFALADATAGQIVQLLCDIHRAKRGECGHV